MDLDIIIPVYNAKDTIKRMLYSIAIQRKAKGFHVYLANDASEENYQEEIEFFQEYLDITELKLPKNGGPGVARQYGINHSNSKYIMFMDSDDYLYDPYALYHMYHSMCNGNYDMVVSKFLYERDNQSIIKEKNLVWLHGKIYRRAFLEEHDIHFNESRANEDNGFNRLVILNKPKILYLDRLTYVYSNYENSITRKENRLFRFTGLEGYTYNMCWAMNKMIEKEENLEEVGETSLGVLTAMYFYYLELYEEYDVEKILEWCIETKKIFDKYKEKYIKPYKITIFLEGKEKEYQNTGLKKRITFEEFLTKIEEVTTHD